MSVDEKRLKRKLTCRERFHFWWCDCFHLASYNDIVYVNERLDLFIKLMDVGWKEQDGFNRLVGDRLGLSVKDDRSRDGENVRVGFIQ